MNDPARPIPVEKLLSVMQGCRSMLKTIEQKLSDVMSDAAATPERTREKMVAAYHLAAMTQQSLNATLEIWRAQEDLATALGQDSSKPKT